ncbi:MULTISPECIES: hypothetical protein [unclassified Moorena]|uniref:hypothetical protein n=1 Tax=unclassified Moorena TaxID=2683338 RepID=UPI0013C6765B|nr:MULTISPECIES: hypothetical protein [unclassified Moorena]NEO20100.1 hypothetical protein [Moorena sp. SIO4A5]NEP20697.1 hypothetical protein [Moorena sp. SIO3I6]NEQ57219.1 hypothetical protein [Moorena sp. SIO4A1]
MGEVQNFGILGNREQRITGTGSSDAALYFINSCLLPLALLLKNSGSPEQRITGTADLGLRGWKVAPS